MPSSPAPNRKRVDRFTWNRGYFHRPTALMRWKTQLSILALVLSGGWLLHAEFMQQVETRHYQFTHGPVALPHAAWDAKCDACHTPFSRDNLTVSNLSGVGARWHDFRCDTCHSGPEDSPKNYAPHHVNADWKDIKTNDCGSCHHEHQGRNSSLVQLKDSGCTQCHKDLEDHHVGKRSNFTWKQIDTFESGHRESHGEFMPRDASGAIVLLGDKRFQRSLHFDHAVHAAPGMKADWTIAKIAKNFQERYRQPNQPDTALVQLSCSSCHQLDAGRNYPNEEGLQGLPRDSLSPPRAGGAYMLPINYDNHCQACHSIQTGPVGIPLANISVPTVKLPHRMTAEQIENYLSAQILRSLAKRKDVSDSPELKNRDRLDPRLNEELQRLKSLDVVVTALVGQAKKQLGLRSPAGAWGTACGKCHQFTDEKIGATTLHIIRPNSPPIWYPHAKFSHSSHRAVTCSACHSTQFPKDTAEQDPKKRVELLNLPGIDNCRQCHTPAYRIEADGRTQLLGGVSHGCVDCHRYHNGDFPFQGQGSPHRDPPEERRLEAADMIRGVRPPSNRNQP